jgi:hypothetical protein
MILFGLRCASVVGLALACAASSVGASTRAGRAPAAEPGESRPGEGVLCTWAFARAAAQIGRACDAGRDPEFQAELERTVGRFEAYARDAGWTPERIAQFEREQGSLPSRGGDVCTGEMTSLYHQMSARGPAALHAAVDRLVSRAGSPTWGDCT